MSKAVDWALHVHKSKARMMEATMTGKDLRAMCRDVELAASNAMCEFSTPEWVRNAIQDFRSSTINRLISEAMRKHPMVRE